MAGYVKIWTTLLSNEAFLSVPPIAKALYVILLIECKRQRDDGIICAPSVHALSTLVACDKRTCDKNLAILQQNSLCTYTINSSGVVTVTIPKYKKWQNLTAKEVVQKPRKNAAKLQPLLDTRPDQTKLDQTNPPISPQGEDEIPYQEIINDLNAITDRHYKNVESTRKLIRGRWKDGHRVEDFKYVHRVKTAEWENEPQWRKFLQPNTLYKASKFDGYRNQPMPGESPLDGLSDKGRATFLAGLRVVKQEQAKRLEIEDERNRTENY